MLIGDPVAVVYALRGNAAFGGGRGADKDPLQTRTRSCNISSYAIFSFLIGTQRCHPRTTDCLYLGTRIGQVAPQKCASTLTAPARDASGSRSGIQRFICLNFLFYNNNYYYHDSFLRVTMKRIADSFSLWIYSKVAEFRKLIPLVPILKVSKVAFKGCASDWLRAKIVVGIVQQKTVTCEAVGL